MSACKYLLMWTLKSPRIVPGAASAGSVSPTSLRDDLTTLCPSHTWKHTNEESEYQLVNLHDSVWCVMTEAQRFDWSSPWRLWGQKSCSKAGWSRRASSAARRSAELKACQKPEKYTDRSCRNTSHTVTSAIWADHSPAASSDQPIGILAAQSAWWSRQSDASERHRASQLPKSVL